jgi:ABC-type transport system substrate-binding protein
MIDAITISRRRALALGAGGLALLGGRRGHAAPGGGTLTLGMVNYPPNIRPFEATGSSQILVKQCLYRGLLSYDAQGALVPEVAAEWRAESPAVHVFRLREAARFHNGDRVTADDVKFSIEQIAAAKSTAYLRADFGIVDRVEVVDASTVRIVLQQPSAPFPHLLASFHAPILSAKVGAADPNPPVGCGPFRFVSAERGVAIEVERFADFYKPGLPKLARIRFQAYGDENLRVAALQAGDVDIIEGVPWQNMDGLEKNARIRMDSTIGPFMYLVFNVKSGPFTNPKLRQAVAFAIDRAEVVKATMYGRGKPLEALPYPPGTPFADAEDRLWEHDPDRAKKLLAEAGMAGGFAAKLLATSSPLLHQYTAEVVQQHLAKIGVQVELQLHEWSTRVAMGGRGQYEFAVMGTAGNWPDPDSLSPLIGTAPAAYPRSFGFSSARIDGLLQAGRAELDTGKRKAIYRDLQAAAAEEVPIVGLAWRSQAFGLQASVQGFHNLPGFLTFYSGITLENTVKV